MLFERFVDAFNEGRIEEVLRDLPDDYVYVDPSSGPLDREGHLALMKRVLEIFPDRRITVTALAVGDGVEFAEWRWEGTPKGGGELVTMRGAGVIDVVDGRMQGQRWYYTPPGNSPLRAQEHDAGESN